jgi:type 1 fimbria pilin
MRFIDMSNWVKAVVAAIVTGFAAYATTACAATVASCNATMDMRVYTTNAGPPGLPPGMMPYGDWSGPIPGGSPGADKLPPGTWFLTGSNTDQTQFSPFKCGTGYAQRSMWVQPLTPPVPGVTFYDSQNRMTHPVYPSGIPGLGYALFVFNQGGPKVPMAHPQTRIANAFITTAGNVRVTAQLWWVVTGRLQRGYWQLPQTKVANVSIRALNDTGLGSVEASVGVYLMPINFGIGVASCNVNVLGSNNAVVPLGKVQTGDFPEINSTAGKGNFQISLSGCNSSNVYMTFTDGTFPGNTGSILSPALDSQVQGLGVQIRRADILQIVSYGPDSSAAQNTNQFYVGKGSDPMIIPFTASYIRTGTVTPGSFSAIATFTMSYQ